MEKDITPKLLELGLTDDQIDAVKLLLENQKKFMASGYTETESGKLEIPVPIRIRLPGKSLDIEDVLERDGDHVHIKTDDTTLDSDFYTSGSSPQEDNDIFDVGEIQKVYDDMLLEFAWETADETTRNKIKKRLEEEFPYYTIKCDDENNPPEVQDENMISARVIHPETQQYVDLYF